MVIIFNITERNINVKPFQNKKNALSLKHNQQKKQAARKRQNRK
jgi:hypothetical protein